MIREEVIDLRGSTQTQRQELYKILIDLEEPIYKDTTLANKIYEYPYFQWDTDSWAGCYNSDYKDDCISIQAFLSKYKKKEPKPGDIMSTIKVGDVYVNSSGKTCTIISTPTKDSPTTYTYRHQDGNTYIVDIGTIERNWVKQLGKSLDLYSRIVALKTVVHCETEEEAIQLLNWAHDQGLKWSDGTSYKEHTSYKVYTSDTCYELKTGQYSGKEYFIRKNYTIIPFSSIPEFQSKETVKTTMIIKDLQPGTKVRIRSNLKENKPYYTTDSKNYSCPNDTMVRFKGEIVTIETKVPNGGYRVKEVGYYWTDEMFSKIIAIEKTTTHSFKVGDTVKFKPGIKPKDVFNGTTIITVENMDTATLTISKIGDGYKKDNVQLSNGYWYGIDALELVPQTYEQKSIEQIKANKSKKEPVAQQEPIKSKSIKKEETFMSKLKAIALTTVDQNKEAAIIAAKMEAGRVINKQVIKQAAKHVPFWAKGYLDTPLAPVVLANAVAMLGNHTGNAKVQKVAELMLLAAADVTVQSFNLDKIIDDVLSGIKLPAGILDDVE
jgi:hypothetical protein